MDHDPLAVSQDSDVQYNLNLRLCNIKQSLLPGLYKLIYSLRAESLNRLTTTTSIKGDFVNTVHGLGSKPIQVGLPYIDSDDRP